MGNCLISLERQTVKTFKVIFVDDCSTDDSVDQLKEYLKNVNFKFDIIKNEVNKGPGYSRNIGVNFSNSDYVSFVDSDDSVELNYIEKLTQCVEKFRYDIVFFDYNRVIKEKVYVKTPTIILKECSTKNEFIAHAFDSMCCMLFKKELLIKIKFPDLYNGEDVAMIPLIIAKSKTRALVKEPLYNYINNIGSLSNIPNSRVYLSFLEAFSIIRNSDLHRDYKTETEFLGIKVVLYNSVLTGIKAGLADQNIIRIIRDFQNDFGNWFDNPYINSLTINKRIYFYLLRRRYMLFLRFYVNLHKAIFN
jgi:glycosyltransferase involved in cell wall biosynthesis